MSAVSDQGISVFASYLRKVRAIPQLTDEEKARLYQEIADIDPKEELSVNDPRAITRRRVIQRLQEGHLRLAVIFARTATRRTRRPIMDIISAANLGLTLAGKTYHPSKGDFGAFARKWINGAIAEDNLHEKSLVKIITTNNLKKVANNLQRLKKENGIPPEANLTEEDAAKIAATLEVKIEDVWTIEKRLRTGRDVSLNQPVSADGTIEKQDTLVDSTPNQEDVLAKLEMSSNRKTMLLAALATLDEREREIYILQRLTDDPVSVRTLADAYGIGKSRIGQLADSAAKKVREHIEAQIKAIKEREEEIRQPSQRTSIEAALLEAPTLLTPRERGIIQLRHIRSAPQAYEEIGLVYGLSGDEVAQIEKAALRKIERRIPIKAGRYAPTNIHNQYLRAKTVAQPEAPRPIAKSVPSQPEEIAVAVDTPATKNIKLPEITEAKQPDAPLPEPVVEASAEALPKDLEHGVYLFGRRLEISNGAKDVFGHLLDREKSIPIPDPKRYATASLELAIEIKLINSAARTAFQDIALPRGVELISSNKGKYRVSVDFLDKLEKALQRNKSPDAEANRLTIIDDFHIFGMSAVPPDLRQSIRPRKKKVAAPPLLAREYA